MFMYVIDDCILKMISVEVYCDDVAYKLQHNIPIEFPSIKLIMHFN